MATPPVDPAQRIDLHFDQEQRALIHAAICVVLRRIRSILSQEPSVEIRVPAFRHGPPSMAAMVLSGIGLEIGENRHVTLQHRQITALIEIIEIATFYFDEWVARLVDDSPMFGSTCHGHILIAETAAVLQLKLKESIAPASDPAVAPTPPGDQT